MSEKRYIVVNETGDRVTYHKQDVMRGTRGRRRELRSNVYDPPTLTLADAERCVRKAKTRLGRRYEIVEVE